MSYRARPFIRARTVRRWMLDNQAPARARLIDDQGRFFTGIEFGPLWTGSFGEVPAVFLTRGEGTPLTVGAYLHWLAVHQVSEEHRLAGEFYGPEYKGFQDLGESSWYLPGDPGEVESWPERFAIHLQLRWG
jgi:hypothetical protein